jgi:hypothetical protein
MTKATNNGSWWLVGGMIAGGVLGWGLVSVGGMPQLLRSPGDPIGVVHAKALGVFMGLLTGCIIVRGVEIKTSWWIVSIGIYYGLVGFLCPAVSCQWPFNEDRLWFLGLIPLAAAIVGLCIYQNQTQRVGLGYCLVLPSLAYVYRSSPGALQSACQHGS